VHDDNLITSAMCTILDRMERTIHKTTTWINPQDPLEQFGKEESGEERVESRNPGSGTGQPTRD
jgi:hypothetical protein